MNNWNFNLDDVPIGEPYLVFLAEEMCGSRVHSASKNKCVNGFLTIVGCYFEHDAPQVLAWRPMIPLPGKES